MQLRDDHRAICHADTKFALRRVWRASHLQRHGQCKDVPLQARGCQGRVRSIRSRSRHASNRDTHPQPLRSLRDTSAVDHRKGLSKRKVDVVAMQASRTFGLDRPRIDKMHKDSHGGGETWGRVRLRCITDARTTGLQTMHRPLAGLRPQSAKPPEAVDDHIQNLGRVTLPPVFR